MNTNNKKTTINTEEEGSKEEVLHTAVNESSCGGSIFSFKWGPFIIIGIIIISLMSFMTSKYLLRLQINNTLSEQRHYAADMYISSVKDKILLPVNDVVQLFGYVDKINRLNCMSMYSAALVGWKYQLFGPSIFNSTLPGLENKFNKLVVYAAIAKSLAPETITIFADSMDVSFQRNANEFEQSYNVYER